MEVANFHSALTNPSRLASSQWLTSGASKDFVLLLPDGTTLKVDIQVKDSSGLKSNDFVQVKVYMNHRLIENGRSKKQSNGNVATDANDTGFRHVASLLDPDHFPLTIQCQPPRPKYTTTEEEPDDNSPAMRASRNASAHLDLTRFLSTTNTLSAYSPEQILASIWVQLYVIMSVLPTEEAFNIVLGEEAAAPAAKMLIDTGLAIKHPLRDQEAGLSTSMVLCTRAAFWQTLYPFKQSPWLLAKAGDTGPNSSGLPRPTTYTFSNNSYHPRRPTKPTASDGPVYKRYIVELGQTLTFEIASSKDEATVKKFAEWQNSDRVNTGWRQRDTIEEHQRYLQRVERTDSSLGLIGKWDGQPFGYFEVYWVKESNISPYYACDDYDRGFHALVGEERFRGPHRVRTWMGSLIHMMFLLDFRTQKVVLEPRASNHKMINYAQMCGGHVEKLIDLPHKRAALVVCPREGFFQLCPLGPLAA